jgi:hypothetical protein
VAGMYHTDEQTVMKISKQMVKSYIRHIFSSYQDFYEESPEYPSGYQNDIENMRRHAAFFGDLDALNLSIGYICTHPAINVLELVESLIEYDEEEVRSILDYAWEILPQDTKQTFKKKFSQVELVDMPIEDWNDLKFKSIR